MASLVKEEKRVLWTEGVAADTACLEIGLDSCLWQLPEGACYVASSGRAHVKASVKGGRKGKPPTLVIESGCDSLERLCCLYAAENELLKVKNEGLSNSVRMAFEKRSKTYSRSSLKWMFLAGLIAGIVITIITRKIYGSIGRNRPDT